MRSVLRSVPGSSPDRCEFMLIHNSAMSINSAAARIQKPMDSGSADRSALYSGQNWASGCCSSCLAELPPFSGRVGCPHWAQKFTSRFSYGFPIFWVQLPLFSPLPFFPVSVPDISSVEAVSLQTFFPYSRIFCCRLWRQRMSSRQDQKGGDGMSISASSVTLAACSRSSVKSDAGWPGWVFAPAHIYAGAESIVME